MAIKSETAEEGQSSYRNWEPEEHLSIISGVPTTCGQSKCIFNDCCKIPCFTCFQCAERILDACGLFDSGSVSFCINAPRKIGNSLKQCIRYFVFICPVFCLARFPGTSPRPPHST